MMAADLSTTPMSGLRTQLCGDAHLSNFGAYASPERRLVFDINDFDETLPGSFEWDVKRLAASLVLAGVRPSSTTPSLTLPKHTLIRTNVTIPRSQKLLQPARSRRSPESEPSLSHTLPSTNRPRVGDLVLNSRSWLRCRLRPYGVFCLIGGEQLQLLFALRKQEEHDHRADHYRDNPSGVRPVGTRQK